MRLSQIGIYDFWTEIWIDVIEVFNALVGLSNTVAVDICAVVLLNRYTIMNRQ